MPLRTAQAEAGQGVGAVTVRSGLVTSRTRPREAQASRAREPGPRVGRGARGSESGYGKENRVSVDPGMAMVANRLDGDDDTQEPRDLYEVT